MVIDFLKQGLRNIKVVGPSANVDDLTNCQALIELVPCGQGGSYCLNEVMFIIGFFKLASLGIEIGEPLKGPIGCQAFSRDPKGGLDRIFILCAQVAHVRALIGTLCRPVHYLRGLVTGGGKGSAATACA